MAEKYCIIEEGKICDDCCGCKYCELDAGKICDNCAKCIENIDKEFATKEKEAEKVF